jgi:NAD-dependent deacetylase
LQLATPEAFAENPALVWRWYAWRRKLVAEVEPNPGHFALAQLADTVPQLTLVTQNVDGLHQRAGSKKVIEFHGNIFDDRCFDEGCVVESVGDGEPPRCPGCGGHIRPGVVWFGEAIPEQARDASFAAAASCDVFLSVGTSSLVYPAAGLIEIARANGATTVEINPEPTMHAATFDYALAARSGSVLPELLESLAAKSTR